MKIQINDVDYMYYEYIDASYGQHAEELNDELNYLRQVLKDADDEIGLSDVSYRLGIYEKDEIDAVVKKDGAEYLIGITKGAFDEFKKWFEMYFRFCDKTYDVFGLEREKCEYYIKFAYHKALEFLVLHEYTHMKDGHCDIPENEEKLVFEQSKPISREKALFCQTLEYDADMWAVAHCTQKIIEENILVEEKNEKLKLLAFSIFTVFKKFSECEKYDFDGFLDEDLLKNTHPLPEVRYRYIMGTIFSNIPDLQQEYRDILEKDLVAGVMNFEIYVLGIGDWIEMLFASGHTQKGTEHLILLHNSWNKVADKLESYAHVELTRVIPFEKESEVQVFFDNNGNVIP